MAISDAAAAALVTTGELLGLALALRLALVVKLRRPPLVVVLPDTIDPIVLLPRPDSSGAEEAAEDDEVEFADPAERDAADPEAVENVVASLPSEDDVRAEEDDGVAAEVVGTRGERVAWDAVVVVGEEVVGAAARVVVDRAAAGVVVVVRRARVVVVVVDVLDDELASATAAAAACSTAAWSDCADAPNPLARILAPGTPLGATWAPASPNLRAGIALFSTG